MKKFKDYSYKEPKIKTNVFEIVRENNHEQLVFGYDKFSGLKVVLAIHDTTLGPSTGGTRMVKVSEGKAIEEALRLSYAMTFKNAIIDEPFGGSKAVVIGDPKKDKNKKMLHALGDFIQSLKGSFLTGVDMGLDINDAKIIAERTDYIFNSQGCSGVTTAHGVYKGIKECIKQVYGSDNLEGKTFAIQGLGYVGGTLVKLLSKHKVNLIVADTDVLALKNIKKEYKVKIVDPYKIYNQKCDVFSPNAIGEIINDKTIPHLKCKIIAGGANNQLTNEKKHSQKLYQMGILHAPDFVINAGGVCHGMCEVKGDPLSKAMKKTDLIPGILKDVFAISKKTNVPPMIVAYQIAEEKIEKQKKYNDKNGKRN